MTALVDEELLERPPQDKSLPRVTPHTTRELRSHLRTPKTLWCPGCSNGIVTRALLDAVLSLDLDPDRTCVIAGIGCAGRITTYLELVDGAHRPRPRAGRGHRGQGGRSRPSRSSSSWATATAWRSAATT